jgi:hypothetical protein
VPVHVLQKWGGWAKAETVLKYYPRVRKSDADKLRDAMRDDEPQLRLVG